MTINKDQFNPNIYDQYAVDVQVPDIIQKDNKDVIQFYQDEGSPQNIYETQPAKKDNETTQDALADHSIGVPEIETINSNMPTNLNLYLPETKIKQKESLSNLEYQKNKFVKNYYKMRE